MACLDWSATRRLAIDRLRLARNCESLTGEPPEGGALDVELERIDLALDLREAMQHLPGDCQEILDRFFARDGSYLTIARELNLSAETVACRISRCLTKLRTQLQGR